LHVDHLQRSACALVLLGVQKASESQTCATAR
jgi:hypothetical protein